MKCIWFFFLMFFVIKTNCYAELTEDTMEMLIKVRRVINEDGYTEKARTMLISIAEAVKPEALSPQERVELGDSLKNRYIDRDNLAFTWILAGLKDSKLRDKYVRSFYSNLAEDEMQKTLEDVLSSDTDLKTFKEIVFEAWNKSRALVRKYQSQSKND